MAASPTRFERDSARQMSAVQIGLDFCRAISHQRQMPELRPSFRPRARLLLRRDVCQLRPGRAILLLIVCILALIRSWIAPQTSVYWWYFLSVILFIPLAPMVFRYSRILWIHFDRYVDP